MSSIDSFQQPLHQHSTDTSGLLCPEPVMMLHRVMRQAKVEEIVHLIATDPSTQRDIPKFCTFLGHELLHQQVEGTVLQYWIRKGS